MMGVRTVLQEALFYGFSLERHAPGDHLLRSINRLLHLSGVRTLLEPYHSVTGRPSIDPELIPPTLPVGHCFWVRSERRLCDEVQLNLAYRWFWRFGQDSAVPSPQASPRTAMAEFLTAIYCIRCSRPWSRAVWRKVR